MYLVDIRKLKARMLLKDMSAVDLSKHLGISAKTMYNRFTQKKFPSNEIGKIIDILEINSPEEAMSIFFADTVAFGATKSTA